MNLAQVLKHASDDQAELVLDFCSFLLRYHRELGYEDFSEEYDVVKKIKRTDRFRMWADIEDLVNNMGQM